MQTGTRVGPYEIIEALGRGGMGEVYRARDPRLQRQLAIKTANCFRPGYSDLRQPQR